MCEASPVQVLQVVAGDLNLVVGALQVSHRPAPLLAALKAKSRISLLAAQSLGAPGVQLKPLTGPDAGPAHHGRRDRC